jgi:hypothetical protein
LIAYLDSPESAQGMPVNDLADRRVVRDQSQSRR